MDNSGLRKKYWRAKIKRRGIEALGGVCAICGNTFEDCCYDFHHMNPDEKEFNISSGNVNSAKNWLHVRDELKKCVLLCANCHRLVHNNHATVEIKNYFNEEYYEWDLCDAKLVSMQTGEPIEANLVCPICGGKKSSAADKCLNCSKVEQRKFDVTREELKELIFTMHFTQIGAYYGVSDNAIRKRCIALGLPSKKTVIKTYSREEWDKI
jgi:hypothetical protein